jgi:hypothetical protein
MSAVFEIAPPDHETLPAGPAMRPRKLQGHRDAELKRILLLRRELFRELSMKRLEERFGVSRQTVWKLEREAVTERPDSQRDVNQRWEPTEIDLEVLALELRT